MNKKNAMVTLLIAIILAIISIVWVNTNAIDKGFKA